jgi:hypothetical protein
MPNTSKVMYPKKRLHAGVRHWQHHSLFKVRRTTGLNIRSPVDKIQNKCKKIAGFVGNIASEQIVLWT